MAFWLANERRGQQSGWMQRFDPRFWTVDFPRPAMASVVTTGADSMRVDCEFHHQGELVGLIWDSVDSLDHPLLAYETRRDYAHSILSFRWQSSNLIPLDGVHGPTLTIEGRDRQGNPRSWYVRLWNYAVGTPTDARITIPFSQVESGWTLPGEILEPGDIDRMFISLAPPGYAPGDAAALPGRVNGSVTISDIACDGANAVLPIGDAYLPPHGERLATAYDDCYNQTPARLARMMFSLGYREEALHYVGMSHFMRLAPTGHGLEVETPAQLCEPARAWHESYFRECRDEGFTVIASLSYELFAAYCPAEWQQRAYDGSPALTGWVPPSTLLSPANEDAMAWLQGVAAIFVGLMEMAGQSARFQIGEPWWWTTADGQICLYDQSSRAAFGGDPPRIADLRAALSDGEKALLDEAGAILANSTIALANAARAAATGPCEILLLAFTPTILNPQMPELYRANLPTGWAWPAFDRLQVEDYDWLTAGQHGPRRGAYDFVNQRLGYPISQQDYLAGFVLDAADAAEFWREIDNGLDEARLRGIARRFVWASPQVARDGYVRLPAAMETDVQAFDDILYPFPLGKTASVRPEFSTSVMVTASGHERRNSLWSDARLHFDVGPGIRSENELAELISFFRARRGAARGFRICDPFDHSSNGMTGTPAVADMLIGIGDGATTDFPLLKRYGSGDEPQIRRISRPRSETLLIGVDGVQRTDYALLDHGVVRFASPPPAGAQITAGFLFDVPVRFEEDQIDISAVNFAAGEAPSIPLVEIREVQ